MENWNHVKQPVSAYALGSNVPTPEPQESPSRIRDGISSSEQLLSAIHDAISSLEKRFDTVLRPMPPSTLSGANAGQSGPVGSHLTGRIAILNEGFQQALARLHELTARAEV
jgi:hypothetical protein